MTSYSFLLTVKKTIKQIVILTIALLASGLLAKYPATANLTVLGGFTVFGLLEVFVDFLKHAWGVKLP